MEAFAKGEWDSIGVVASITSEPAVAPSVLEDPKFVPALVALLVSGDSKALHAAWGITANLSHIPGFGATVHSLGGFKGLPGALATGPAGLQTLVVTAVWKMCVADNMLAGVLMTEGVVMKLAELCGLHTEPALQHAAVFACSDVSLRYMPFLEEFMKVGGMEVVMSAANNAQDPMTRERAIYFLTCAISMDEAAKNTLSQAVPVFTDALFSGATTAARIHAAAGLGYFAKWLAPQDEAAIVNSGAVLALVAALSDSMAVSPAQDIEERIARSRLRRTTLDTLGLLLSRSEACRKAALDSSALTTTTAILCNATGSSAASKKAANSNGGIAAPSDPSSASASSSSSSSASAVAAVPPVEPVWKPSLVVLRQLLRDPGAQGEFCAAGGVELLRDVGEHEPAAKKEILEVLADLSARNPQAARVYGSAGDIGGVLQLLGAQDPAVRARALGTVANLIAHDAAGVTQELVARRAIPPVIATFISAPPDSEAKRSSLAIIAAAWLSGNAGALALFAKFQAPEHVVPVLASSDPLVVVPALVVLSLARMPEDRIVPGSSGPLTTEPAIANLCKAAARVLPRPEAWNERDDEEVEGKNEKKQQKSSLELIMSGGDDDDSSKVEADNPDVAEKLAAKMALYILSVLLRKYPEAARPHICAGDSITHLFARLCAPEDGVVMPSTSAVTSEKGEKDGDTFESVVGVLLLTLRQGTEVRGRLLDMSCAPKCLDALFAACTSASPSAAAAAAELLSILSSAPGRCFPALAEKTTNYPLVATALAAAVIANANSVNSSPQQQGFVRSLLVVLCAVLRSESARTPVARVLGFETFAALLSSPANAALAITAAGALACTNAFRAAQGAQACSWATLLASALPADADEEASVRALTAIVGFAPCAAFREAFRGCSTLVARVSALAAAAANPQQARAQMLAVRALALLRVHAAARSVFDATVAQKLQSGGVLAEALRFYANLPHETLWDIFGEDERRIRLLWEARTVNPSPASVISLFTICTKLAEDDALRERMVKVIPLGELARLAESFPYVADYAAMLKICLGF